MSAGLVPDEAATPGGRWSRQRLGPRSLTARLVIGVVALVVVLVTAIGGGHLRGAAFVPAQPPRPAVAVGGRAERRVLRPLLRARRAPEPQSNEINCFPSLGPPLTQREWIAFIGADGSRPLQLTSNRCDYYRPLDLPPSVTARLAHAQRRLDRASTTSGEELMLRAERDEPGSSYVVTGLSTGEVRNTLRQLVMLEAADRRRGGAGRAARDDLRRAVQPAPAPAGHGDGERGGRRAVADRPRPRTPRRGRRRRDRGGPARAVDEHAAVGGRDAVRRAAGERGAVAPVPRRRLARAAHAADVHPRLRRTGPHAEGGRGNRRGQPGAHRVRGHPHVAPGRGPAHPRPRRPARRAGRAS